MFGALLLTSIAFIDFSYSPPEAIWIDYTDVSIGWEIIGRLDYYTDVGFYVNTEFTSEYIPPPPAYPIPVYNHFHLQFNDSVVTSIIFGGNTLEVIVDRNIIFRNNFEDITQ